MAILRIQKKDRNFLMLEKTCIEDKRLSWKAKGLHTYLMGLPDNWAVNVSELSSRSTDGEDSIYSGLRELISKGYVTQSKQRGQDGRFLRGDYMVYEKPQAVEAPPRTDTPVRTEAMVHLQEEVASEDVAPLVEHENSYCVEGRDLQPVALSPTPQKPARESPHRVNPVQENPCRENPGVDQPEPGNRELINININNYLNNKNTTAEEILGIVEPKDASRPAAVVNKKINQEDLLIEKTLTPQQLEQIHELARLLFVHKKYNMDLSTLESALQTTLLDERAFTQAGHDFFKKFNTLKKCIHEGKWIPPILQPEKPKAKSEMPVQVQQEQKYRALLQDLQHWKGLLTGAMRDGKEGLQASISQIVANCEQKMAAFLQSANGLNNAGALQ